jgi:hypothetical protein
MVRPQAVLPLGVGKDKTDLLGIVKGIELLHVGFLLET